MVIEELLTESRVRSDLELVGEEPAHIGDDRPEDPEMVVGVNDGRAHSHDPGRNRQLHAQSPVQGDTESDDRRDQRRPQRARERHHSALVLRQPRHPGTDPAEERRR